MHGRVVLAMRPADDDEAQRIALVLAADVPGQERALEARVATQVADVLRRDAQLLLVERGDPGEQPRVATGRRAVAGVGPHPR
jgi:hypothetical protein